jgi:hypothetical protein
LYTDDITGWEFCFGADADRYGDIRNELYQTPDGLYVHVCYHSDERVKLNDGTITTAHEVVQVGERIKTTLVLDGAENEEDDACADYLLGEGGVVEAHWRNTTVSLSSEYGLEGWVEDYDADALRGAGKHEITFEVELTDQR